MPVSDPLEEVGPVEPVEPTDHGMKFVDMVRSVICKISPDSIINSELLHKDLQTQFPNSLQKFHPDALLTTISAMNKRGELHKVEGGYRRTPRFRIPRT